MAASKLVSADRQEIVRLYVETEATISQLAKQFGSSTSTISRLLQDAIPDHQYRQLVGKKVGRGRKPKLGVGEPIAEPTVEQLAFLPESDGPCNEPANDPDSDSMEVEIQLPVIAPREEERAVIAEIAAEFDTLGASGEEFDADDEDEDLEDEEEELPEAAFPKDEPLPSVLPLSAATLPQLCYLVVDRNAELVTRPAKDFSELGTFAAEEQLRIMPIFYNHRVAKRFADHNSTHRVIKCPSSLLDVTYERLRQRGIGYLLCDRQLFSLP
ncbi:MAG: transposase [Oscillatoriales cyanobacterium SM2_2_1]|nr:transposase [Oscillatoriales cyanobacterium SM2_2_1]